MDKAGVDVGVLLVTDSETVTGKGASNDFMAEVMESYGGRFICFGVPKSGSPPPSFKTPCIFSARAVTDRWGAFPNFFTRSLT